MQPDKFTLKNYRGGIIFTSNYLWMVVKECFESDIGGYIYEIDHKVSQKTMLVEAMKLGYMLNKWNAMKFANCMTLAQRIKEINDDIAAGILKGYGKKVQTKTDPEHNNAMIYWLEKEGNENADKN